MLTKEELTQKKTQADGDTPLEKKINAEKLLHRKRFFIILSIFLTIGLSCAFVIYRQIKEIIIHPPSLSLPNFTLPHPSKISSPNSIDQLTSTISSIITTNPTKWNIVVSDNQQIYNWPSNHSILSLGQINSLKNKLGRPSLASPIAGLPEGIDVKQYLAISPDIQKLTLIINPPGQSFFINLEYQGSNTNFEVIVPQLVSAIYWQLIGLSS